MRLNYIIKTQENRIKKYIVFIVLICTSWNFNDPREAKVKERDLILHKFSKQMRKRGLYAIGKGGGCNRDLKTNLVSITFEYHEIMDIENARELIVESTKNLLELFNNNPKQEPYFAEFPVPVKMINIGILGDSPATQNSLFVNTVFITQSDICYCTNEPRQHPSPTASEETFTEAQYILDHPDEVHRREVTSVQKDAYGQTTELSGPWGMVIKRFAIQQIESGQFEYFVIEDCIKKPFKVVDGVLCCS